MNGQIVNELKVCLRLWTVSTQYVDFDKLIVPTKWSETLSSQLTFYILNKYVLFKKKYS